MECHTVLVFIGLFIIPVIASSEEEELLNKLNNLIGTQKDLLRTYVKHLDNAVSFKELRGSLQLLDKLAQDYNGKCRADIYNATSIGYKCTDNYYRATDKIFRWCALMAKLLKYLLKNEKTIDQNYILMLNTTNRAVKAVTEAHALLELVRDDLTMMQNILRPVPSYLNYEFDQYKKWQDHARKKRCLDGLINLIIGSPKKRIRKMESQRKNQFYIVFQNQFISLTNSVQKIQDSGKKVQEELVAEITKVNELLGQFDVVELLGDEIGSFCEDDLKDLLKSVTDYMDRHSNVDETVHYYDYDYDYF
uniref:Uncharacterized protein n=1 Tax=Cacopsylla melanoneura TaxID=428564 RepID=A0A8D8MAF0_9HEMI